MTNNEIYFDVIARKYDEVKHSCIEICKKNGEEFSEDVFQDTIIKVNDIITKKGSLDDMSEKGILNYFVKSFINNLRCEKRNSYICKRDLNVSESDMCDIYERTSNPLKDKLINDLLEDFSVLYVMKIVEERFDGETFYLFRLKTLCNMTYKQIANKTKIKKAREKIIEVNKFLRDNLTRKDILEAFNTAYGNLII